jgi:hypothetical protein
VGERTAVRWLASDANLEMVSPLTASKHGEVNFVGSEVVGDHVNTTS